MLTLELGHDFHVEHQRTVGSTNDAAKERAAGGAAEGLIILADEQTRGRGRHGRAWQSPPGNLYASLLLRPAVSLADAATVSLVTALAVAETLDLLVGEPLRLRLKWPNDVLLDGGKVAGILVEGADDGHGNTAFVVVGIGINLAWAPGGPDSTATSLDGVTGTAIAPRELLARLAPALARRLEAWRRAGFAALREDWLARAQGVGSVVTLKLGNDQISGRLADVGLDGSILIESAVGCMTRYTAGELFFG